MSVFVLQLAIIFIDMEGSPVQELSAIHMNAWTKQIVDVYHAHAFSHQSDLWARTHIHGLALSFLNNHGFRDEEALIQNFKRWLVQKDIVSLYANGPGKESEVLNIPISDIGLPPWADRIYQPYHQMALSFKREFIPILDKRCCFEAHAAFTHYNMKRLNETEIAKSSHGFHCSLYDAYELYLSYISN